MVDLDYLHETLPLMFDPSRVGSTVSGDVLTVHGAPWPLTIDRTGRMCLTDGPVVTVDNTSDAFQLLEIVICSDAG